MSRISAISSSPVARGSILLAVVIATALALATWKQATLQASSSGPAGAEPSEVISTATASPREHRPTASAIGTVLALRSVTLRNELSGTVARVALVPGAIVERGTVLVALDVAVEQAELHAREAQLSLAETTLSRLNRLLTRRAVSQEEVDRALAQRDVAAAEIERIRAIIARKTIRAPFTARVGMADLHVGQYLSEGTELTTLQGIDDAAHVDFTVGQAIAAGLRVGDTVLVSRGQDTEGVPARIVAIDARVDPSTRNAVIRARVQGADDLAPGASVRVVVPAGAMAPGVAVPVSALRTGPEGDHVWIIENDEAGMPRSHLRPVRAGVVVGDTVLIQDGLQVGERVAAAGSFKLRPGALVSVVEANAAAGSSE